STRRQASSDETFPSRHARLSAAFRTVSVRFALARRRRMASGSFLTNSRRFGLLASFLLRRRAGELARSRSHVCICAVVSRLHWPHRACGAGYGDRYCHAGCAEYLTQPSRGRLRLPRLPQRRRTSVSVIRALASAPHPPGRVAARRDRKLPKLEPSLAP